MKKIKKLVAIALTAVMVMALAVPSFAATTQSTDTGSITINGLSEGVTVSAYQIAKATYDSDGNFLGYEMTVSGDFGFTINPDGSYTEGTLTEANLAALWNAVSSNAASGTAQVDMGATSATITGLPVGSYLIVVSGSESVAYGMMIGSVSYAVDEETGEWIIDNGSFTVQDCELWAKATTPTVEKTEHHTGGNDTHGESTNVGDEVTFDITISNIPSYQGDNPEFEVDDVLTGLTISDAELNAMTVKIVDASGATVVTLVKDTDYTVTKVENDEGKDEFDVNFVVDGKYTLNAYANQDYSIVIEYQATVSDTAEYVNGEAEYDNDATLKYSTTSYVAGNEGTSEDHDYEYTFAMNAEKTDKDNQALEGATFGLFTDSACTNPYTQTQSDGTEKTVTATSDAEGNLAFSGLAEGIYYLKETEAPAGYLLNQTVYTVQISAEYKEDGSIDSWSITVNGEGLDGPLTVTGTADTGLTIINTKTGLLPSMGGRGTLIFTIIGCAIVACAAVGVVAYRRRRVA